MTEPTTHHVPVAIIGGGQAGLSMSWCLKQRGIEHLVFEKHKAAHSWSTQRWDSFCLVTPNWQCQLPGHPYTGDDPDGFMLKHEIVAYLEAYKAKVDPPLREGVSVNRVIRSESGFAISTSEGDYSADRIVVASGGYHQPIIPRMAERLPGTIQQLHSEQYRNPASLPPGAVLVVGSGQSARRSPRIFISPGGRFIWQWETRRVAHASIAAATSSPGSARWAITTCRSRSTRCAKGCATTPTTMSPAATAAATSICGPSPARG